MLWFEMHEQDRFERADTKPESNLERIKHTIYVFCYDPETDVKSQIQRLEEVRNTYMKNIDTISGLINQIDDFLGVRFEDGTGVNEVEYRALQALIKIYTDGDIAKEKIAIPGYKEKDDKKAYEKVSYIIDNVFGYISQLSEGDLGELVQSFGGNINDYDECLFEFFDKFSRMPSRFQSGNVTYGNAYHFNPSDWSEDEMIHLMKKAIYLNKMLLIYNASPYYTRQISNISQQITTLKTRYKDADIRRDTTFSKEFDRAGNRALGKMYKYIEKHSIANGEDFKKQVKSLPAGANLMIMDHYSSSQYFGIPTDVFSQLFEGKDLSKLIIGSCYGKELANKLIQNCPGAIIYSSKENDQRNGFNLDNIGLSSIFPMGYEVTTRER